ncbi:relaxase/mobilization nuclease domain-containing protein [Pedobacter petrophilus]|uniref:Relaxase/mobilization nuclease domain-containing protein n=1 Tax=Pedobacter petrophilus TaxID=1908241 RepID=A0A7K0G510_9SPHI|nr:relaxase/mobilization nuclease domain-containing protein [Pedobacter petrophilus]MRX78732.1 relaxase/mobilization nuclease domain-containing protein [Pedobacter petrophilus]
MVVEVSTGKGFRATVSYVQKEHEPNLTNDRKPEIIEKNNIYGNTRDMAKQMRFVANANERVSKPVMHFSVNFSKDEKISEEQRQQAVKSVLKEVGVKEENHQYFIVKHNDTENPHYHIVLNKVDLDGKKLNLGFDGKREEFIKNRLQVVADKIEKEQGLKRTEGRNIIYDPGNEKGYRFLTAEEKAQRKPRDKKISLDKDPNKREQQSRIQNEVKNVLQDKNITTPDQFKQALDRKGVDVRFSENKNGISGVAFKTDKISVKGSQIGAKWSDISRVLQNNSKSIQETKNVSREALEGYLKEDLQKVISQSLSIGYSANVSGFLKNRGLTPTPKGYSYKFNDAHFIIKSDLEKGILNTILQSKALQTKYEERKAYEEKVKNAKPMEIKPVPFLFAGKIKEENLRAEAYNSRLEQEKEKIKQNPAKEPSQERKALINGYIERAVKSEIQVDEPKNRQEKELSRFEQIKAQREEKDQDQEKKRGFKR